MIKEGIFKEGDKLPTEPQLAKQLNVSRSTLREAIKLLQIQGILTSKNGIGTYVNRINHEIKSSLNLLQSTKTMLSNSGIAASQSDMNIYKRSITDEWKEKLNCDEQVTIIERIRHSEDKNLTYTFNIFPCSVAESFFDCGITGSLLSFLEKSMGIYISYSLSEICIPDGNNIFDEKALLKLSSKTMLLKQLHFDKNDKPIFYSYDYMDNNYIKFYVKRVKSI